MGVISCGTGVEDGGVGAGNRPGSSARTVNAPDH